MKAFRRFFYILTVLFLTQISNLGALSLTDLTSTLGTIFEDFYSDNEGTTSFHSLLIPVGGRSESLGSAYTGLSDDAGYFSFNPAAACLQKETQMAIFHNSWIADSNMETISYTNRFRNLGFGAQASCFYVPFTEYNLLGERTTGNYYSETNIVLNAAYNFLAGYDFKGLGVGLSLKGAWRSVPDFTDNDTNEIIKNSGLSQSSLGIMADMGMFLQFNFLKFFASRDPNVRIGLTLQNLGVAFTGFGTGNIKLDDPLPTYIAAGMSVRFLPFVSVTADIKQPFNLQHILEYHLFSFSTGVTLNFTENFELLAGFELKGGNPRISAGAEFELNNTRVNFNYTLDLTTSVNPVNRISLSAKILLGDNGRADEMKVIDAYYLEGLKHYYSAEWVQAIESWNKVLEINKRYDPAILGIKSAQAQLNMIRKAQDSMYFEDSSDKQSSSPEL